MKAGVAAMVVAAERAADAGHDGDVVLALVADEEHASLGTAAVLEHLAGRLPDACIVGEPTWLDVIVAHRGFSAIEVEIRGRAAHSSRPARRRQRRHAPRPAAGGDRGERRRARRARIRTPTPGTGR